MVKGTVNVETRFTSDTNRKIRELTGVVSANVQ